MKKRGPNGRCQVCQHVDRISIELGCAGPAGIAAIARKYKLNDHAVRRHWANHLDTERKANLVLGPVQRAALSARVAEENASVLDSLKVIRAGLYDAFAQAQAAGDLNATGLLAGRLHENLRIMGRITGDLALSPLVSITNNNQTTIAALVDSPDFARFWDRVVNALAAFDNFPAIRDALFAVIAEHSRPALPAPDGGRTLEHSPDAESP